jgi:citrate synthase
VTVKVTKDDERLSAVHADATAVSVINPELDVPSLRGYSVEELCRWRSFEEVAYLLWHGELPTHDEILTQNRAERTQRAIGPAIAAAIADQPFTAHPMDMLRTAVTLLGASDPAEHDVSPGAIRARALRLFAVLPSVIAMDHRRRHGLGAVMPRSHLSYAANFLCMAFGKVPEPQIVAAFEASLILCAGYSPNDSAIAGSTAPDVYGAVAAAIDALKNQDPPYGISGAVMGMMNEIAIPDNAKPWLDEALADGRKITGFGHSVHKNGDSRVRTMRAALGRIAALRGGRDVLEIYDALAAAMYDAKGLHPTLEYPVGLAYHLIGFDAPTFSPILVAARLPGWTASIARQSAANDPAQDGAADRRAADEK